MASTLIIAGLVTVFSSAAAFYVGRGWLQSRFLNGPFDAKYEISVVAKKQSVTPDVAQ